MTRYAVSRDKRNTNELYAVLLLMLTCLLFLVVGNILFHTKMLPVTVDVASRFQTHFSFSEIKELTLFDFLFSVISASKSDLICLLFIAFSGLTKIPRTIIFGVFAYRSTVFGYCGAYIVATARTVGSFWETSVMWLLFFVYHIAYFSVLICFGAFTIQNTSVRSIKAQIGYFATVCCELALTILLNVVYYFLISII